MTKETSWKQFLTKEVLHEIWHESKITENSNCSCGRPYHLGTSYDHKNNTFDNFSDMLSLYEVIFKDGRWGEFGNYSYTRWYDLFSSQKTKKEYIRWLLYFADNKDYEDRCKLVAEFYGWKEEEK